MPGCRPPVRPAPHPGRYHAVGDPWPLYGSLDEATAWAEWAQATGSAVRPEDDPRWLCVLEADLWVLDLRRHEVRAALGVALDDLTAPWSPDAPNATCLAVAAAAAELGADGFIVPSAAPGGGWNVDVLPDAFGKLRQRSRRSRVPRPPAS